MNRWVLLEHKVPNKNLVDTHYDFLLEDEKDCLTWKFLEIPTYEKECLKIFSQPNHRLVWLSREKFILSRNRGEVKRVDFGTFIKVSSKFDFQGVKVILEGTYLNGIIEIAGNICRFTKNI